MSEQEFLIAIAELSIALIAFTNIVVALKQMGGGCLTDFQVLVVRLFSVCGFCAIFFALLPILLSYFGVDDAWTWRISNPLLGISIFSINAWYFRQRRRVVPNRGINVANYLTTAILYASLVLLALGTLGFYLGGSIAPFAFTLVGLLVASAVAFLNTLSDFLIAPGSAHAEAGGPNARDDQSISMGLIPNPDVACDRSPIGAAVEDEHNGRPLSNGDIAGDAAGDRRLIP